jgi:DNA-binding transcriptional MerR regulator
MIHITEMARETGASADEIRYIERKGAINPQRIKIKQRRVREFSEGDTLKVKLIIKYRRTGYTWSAAIEKGLLELQNPSLL